MQRQLLISFITLFSVFTSLRVSAQINDNSPYPADFVVNSPGSISGIYDYSSNAEDLTTTPPSVEWGPRLSQTVTADLVWAYDGTDSLGCHPITTDLTGKMALIRRGVCGFSLKVYHAQQAGAVGVVIVNHYNTATENGNTLFGMLGGDSAALVVIPSIFVSRNTGEAITSELDNGGTVNVSFRIKTFYDAVTSYSYHTPVGEEANIDVFQVNLINPDPVNTVAATVTMEITDPLGDVTEFTSSADIAPETDQVIAFTDTYLPSAGVGDYLVKFTNNVNAEEINTKFVITPDTWAVDNGEILGSVGPADATFATTYGLRYKTANLVITGDQQVVTPYVSFGIGNAAVLNATGDETIFQIRLYDADMNGDNTIDLSTSFDDLTDNVVAAAEYKMKGTEVDNELLFVQLESFVGPTVLLEPNHPYYVAIEYDGGVNGNGIAPRFTNTNSTPYLNFPTTPLELDVLYTGWAGSTVVTRLITDDFVLNTGEQVDLLDASKLSVSPNPATSFVNLNLDLAEMAKTVEVGILNSEGKLLRVEKFENVKTGTYQIETQSLGAGTYFLSVKTPEGWRSKQVVVIK